MHKENKTKNKKPKSTFLIASARTRTDWCSWRRPCNIAISCSDCKGVKEWKGVERSGKEWKGVERSGKEAIGVGLSTTIEKKEVIDGIWEEIIAEI
jgi:hypothetical protein